MTSHRNSSALSNTEKHKKKVESVSSSVKVLSLLGKKVRISKGVDSHFVPNPYEKRGRTPKVDLSELQEIVEIDTANKTCTAECGVTFETLVRATLKHGLIPTTVPELRGITLGGAIAGCSVESMSYALGGFHEGCLEYEVVTGTGEILTCSREKNPELFHMIHGSYGTLGLLTSAKFRLIDAKPFVKMEYRKFTTFDGFQSEMKARMAARDFDFIDGIIHGPNELVLCLGKMVDKAPHTSSYKWLNIFYKSTSKLSEDYLTIEDYFFRYDAECHWLTKTVPLLETKAARLLVGKFVLGSTNLIKWSKKLAPVMRLKKRPDVVVDVFIPQARFGEFFEWYKTKMDFYPLWIVPYKPETMYPWIDSKYATGIKSDMFIDCAIYGKPNSEALVDYSELLEKKTIELNGIKTLISRNHFDEESFWKVYDKERYFSVKEQTDPDGLFLDLYKKFSPERYK